MKTKILAISVAAIIGTGAYMHGGHKPRCLLQLFASKKTEVKVQPTIATLTVNANDPTEQKKKEQRHKNDAVNVR